MSSGLAAILASSSDMGMYVTCNFFPVFSSYALNISLNDYLQVLDRTSGAGYQVIRYLVVPNDGKGSVLQLLWMKLCQNI